MKALLYCNKQKPYLEYSPQNAYPNDYMCFYDYGDGDSEFGPLNGYVVAEIECDKNTIDDMVSGKPTLWEVKRSLVRREACKSIEEMNKYSNKDIAYTINDLKIFDDFDKAYLDRYSTFDLPVIKCKSEELCKVLNKQQTIIIRKR